MASTAQPVGHPPAFTLQEGRIEATFNGSTYGIRYRTKDNFMDKCALKLFRGDYVKFDNPNGTGPKIYVYLPDTERVVIQEAKSKGIYDRVLERDVKDLKEELQALRRRKKVKTVGDFIRRLPVLKEATNEDRVVEHMYQGILREDLLDTRFHTRREKLNLKGGLMFAYNEAKKTNTDREFYFKFKTYQGYKLYIVTPTGDLYRVDYNERGEPSSDGTRLVVKSERAKDSDIRQINSDRNMAQRKADRDTLRVREEV